MLVRSSGVLILFWVTFWSWLHRSGRLGGVRSSWVVKVSGRRADDSDDVWRSGNFVDAPFSGVGNRGERAVPGNATC
jgi:hypothetical protein